MSQSRGTRLRGSARDNTLVTTGLDRARAQLERGARAFRQLADRPDWRVRSALALTALAVLETSVYSWLRSESSESWTLALLVALLSTLPLAVRGKHLPVATAAITFATILALTGSTPTWTVAGIAAQLWVLYLAAARYRLVVSILLGILFVTVAFISDGEYSGSSEREPNAIVEFALSRGPQDPPVFVPLLALAALALGVARKRRDQAIAERDTTRLAMATTLEDQTVLQERTRIARELHDVVAHHISAIAIQAETARLTTPGMPEEGQRRLQAINATARTALSEMRHVLGVLRTDLPDGVDRAPQPGLDQLDTLIDTARAAGTPVRVTMHGHPVPLSPGVDLTAYRIVQEALANARRHAPGADVDVSLDYGADTLHLHVRDNGPGPAAGESIGHGLLGMRERAAMVGGQLRVGPAADGGFSVDADLPLGGPAT